MILALALSFALADDDDDEREEHEHHAVSTFRRPVTVDPLYTSECGSCHVAYPAMLLPTRSWVQVMGHLDDHYGDVATLDPASRAKILSWLAANSADADPAGRRIAATPGTPLRITEMSWFKSQHDEIPARLVTGNPQVKSWAACAACHPAAAKGRFDEDEIRIPGAGRWED